MGSFIVSLIPLIILFVLRLKKAFHMLQQNWYNKSNRYLKWIHKNMGRVFFSYDLIFFVVLILGIFIDMKIMVYVYCISFAVVSYIALNASKKEQVKKPLCITARIKRLTLTLIVLYAIPCYFVFRNFDIEYMNLYYLVFILMSYLIFMVVYVVNIINRPIEYLVFLHFKNQALKKVNDMKSMEIIGITGSYGKTSSKNIISSILNVKYNAFPTPENFNTPYGIINTINNYIDKFNDYFVVEMSATKVGDIKDCTEIVRPKYGIITKIGDAHLESFGSKKNIENTKFEIIEALPSDGLGILNGDDEIQMKHKISNNVRIMTIGIDNKDVDARACNIKLSSKGTSFDVIFKGDKTKYHFETCLLGKSNVYNLLTGILLGKYLGISIEQLMLGVKNVLPVPHRLEIKQHGSLYIIDDAYNSNPEGSAMATQVLGMMPGKTIMVTPGMVDLGSMQEKANYEFGKNISDNKIDEVILVGEKQTLPIKSGLQDNKYDKKKIHVVNDIKDAFTLINSMRDKETYVLLENDLPDVFNE